MGVSDIDSGNGKTIIITSMVMIIVFIAVSTLIFFVSLKSDEQVMVPNVIGKDLPEALLELQARELYPRIQLRYSQKVDEKGLILEQKPNAGAIVKGGKRIELVVSQGVIVDTVQNYIGENIEEVQDRIRELFSGSRQYLRIKQPYLVKYSAEPAGTILEQNPAAGTPISNNMELTFVVSKGTAAETVKVPDLVNAGLKKIYQTMQKTALTFVFVSDASVEAKAVTVQKQSVEAQSEVPVFSPVALTVLLPKASNGTVSGILKSSLAEFPYPFTVSLYATYPNGKKERLVSFRHPGGDCSVPYMEPEGTNLSLEVLNKEVYTETVSVKE